MNITNKFSLMDFLSYLIPGVIDGLGIYLILLLTPLKEILLDIQINIMAGIIFLAVCFVLGIILSGFSEILLRNKLVKKGGIKDKILIIGFEEELIGVFKKVFTNENLIKEMWSINHFYFCRTLVFENMPKAREIIERQSSLRQLRMNLLPTICIIFIAGILYGIRFQINGEIISGYIMITMTLILIPIVFISLINRMNSNEKREVRETLMAFITGYKTDIINNRNNTN